ncbi:Tctex-1-domain-containing protein [Basidiobolus meristosporus CBS 931.73]|uniref:Tctex-1-domain-containing protein n=1 Tax=Basidiobolus meristosporus CBS 931.73 TaxID=1314790 RepID=A0A1Y1Y5Q7_9FUNG|nr:Tctex-1-domain-containing protein [Basidiobolus meristosporus CBS 931.73]|eukprot:ORX93299.1 Tctex-1-domain-containing protein [Basidiobolus meristosporus CBS 931.73]
MSTTSEAIATIEEVPAVNPTAEKPVEKSEKVFDVEQVTSILKQTVENTIVEHTYVHSRAKEWNNTITENCLKRLALLNKSIKYIVNCTILENNGSGIHTANSCYWDEAHDAMASYHFTNDVVHVIVTAYGCAV